MCELLRFRPVTSSRRLVSEATTVDDAKRTYEPPELTFSDDPHAAATHRRVERRNNAGTTFETAQSQTNNQPVRGLAHHSGANDYLG